MLMMIATLLTLGQAQQACALRIVSDLAGTWKGTIRLEAEDQARQRALEFTFQQLGPNQLYYKPTDGGAGSFWSFGRTEIVIVQAPSSRSGHNPSVFTSDLLDCRVEDSDWSFSYSRPSAQANEEVYSLTKLENGVLTISDFRKAAGEQGKGTLIGEAHLKRQTDATDHP